MDIVFELLQTHLNMNHKQWISGMRDGPERRRRKVDNILKLLLTG